MSIGFVATEIISIFTLTRTIWMTRKLFFSLCLGHGEEMR